MSANTLMGFLCLCLASHISALTYDEALDQAVGYDKKYASAIFESRSAEYLPTIGRAGLLPKISLNGFQAANKLSQSQADIFGQPNTTQQNYLSQSYSAQLTQPLINLSAIAAYLQSTEQEKAAKQKLNVEFNDLKTKVIEAYCSLASAQEARYIIVKELNTLTEQEKIAVAKQVVGAYSRTDVEEITYTKLQSQANLDEENNSLIQAKITLEKLIGREISTKELLTLPQSYLPINSKLGSLIDAAKDGNPKIQYQKNNLESAIYENIKNKSAYSPTVDIVGYQGYQNSNTISTIGQKSNQGYIGLQLNISLVNGGETFGKERQSAFFAESQKMLLESEINDVEESVKKLHSQANISNEKLSTLRLQVTTANLLYTSLLKQKELGTKSTYDLLISLRRKFQSERELSLTKFERIRALKKLEVVIGGF